MDNNTLAEVREALKIATAWNNRVPIIIRDQLKQALAKLDAMIEAQGWQHIETAPMDGTVILAFFPIGKGKRLYGNTKMVNFDYQSWRIYPGQSVIKSHPTHWMPLPKPPTQGDGG